MVLTKEMLIDSLIRGYWKKGYYDKLQTIISYIKDDPGNKNVGRIFDFLERHRKEIESYPGGERDYYTIRGLLEGYYQKELKNQQEKKEETQIEKRMKEARERAKQALKHPNNKTAKDIIAIARDLGYKVVDEGKEGTKIYSVIKNYKGKEENIWIVDIPSKSSGDLAPGTVKSIINALLEGRRNMGFRGQMQ